MRAETETILMADLQQRVYRIVRLENPAFHLDDLVVIMGEPKHWVLRMCNLLSISMYFMYLMIQFLYVYKTSFMLRLSKLLASVFLQKRLQATDQL